MCSPDFTPTRHTETTPSRHASRHVHQLPFSHIAAWHRCPSRFDQGVKLLNGLIRFGYPDSHPLLNHHRVQVAYVLPAPAWAA
jgi:hypothetical protein